MNPSHATRVFEVAGLPYPGRPPEPGPASEASAEILSTAREALGTRTVWHVNSTCDGGGVAELLRSYLQSHNAAGITTRWLVADASPEFFAITKRIYFKTHGTDQDTAPFTSEERALYSRVTREHSDGAARFIRPGDLVVLHDPQTLGMAAPLRSLGAVVVWQCHLGSPAPDLQTEQAWEFLNPYLRDADGYVFSHHRYVPDGLETDSVRVILPAIDPHSPKNRVLDHAQVRAVLDGIGLTPPSTRADSLGAEIGRRPGWSTRLARVEQDAPLPPDAPVVLQVSRWDPFKDMVGVLTAFAEHVAPATEAHLVLAGPDPRAIADDPGGTEVLEGVREQRSRLPSSVRRRVHLVATAGDDPEGTAFVINALQRQARVVTQKSIREGFGLTIAEGMWKRKPVVAPAVGAIAEQVVNGRTGILIPDPLDLAGFGEAVRSLVSDAELSARIGLAGREHCADRFLIDRQLEKYAEFFTYLCVRPTATNH